MQLLTAQQTYAADNAAISSGIKSCALMENAGKAVASEIIARFPKNKILVLCGPGNNGGDGFVVARILAESGWDVTVAAVTKDMHGDAAVAAAKWQGKTKPLTADMPVPENTIIIDALFGVGLSRKVKNDIAAVITRLNKINCTVVAVDIPSGINADTGEIMGEAVEAELTVTFTRKKIGHVLLPGKHNCGAVVVADIGISDAIIDGLHVTTWENTPALWLKTFPFPKMAHHKYNRGHVVVSGGKIDSTGATCLAAMGALRAGAGLVTVASPEAALPVYAAKLTAIMAKPFGSTEEFQDLLSDKRKNVVILGPGNGITATTRKKVKIALKMGKIVVIDADAITAFSGRQNELCNLIKSPVVLTPHEGEFSRFFPCEGSKIKRAAEVARLCGGVVVLKGADTVIAAPDGRLAVNTSAPPYLATAGTGDILAGIIGGLLAQGMEIFSATCAAVWMHGQAANKAGIGMIAEDLLHTLPEVLAGLDRVRIEN